jgi:TP901 family phage tail tape measure protein
MSESLAKAYVQIIPTSQGLGGKLSEMLDGEADKAGVSAGSKLGAGMVKGLKMAGAAIGAATAAIGAFAKSSIDAGMAFDSSMSQVAATMGTTVDQIGELRDFAQEMGSTTAFSATQAADALNYMALAGYDAETSMNMLPNVLNLAAAGGMELATASDMVTDASSALGLSIDETSLMVDKMAKASSITNTSVAQLGDAILAVGGTAKGLSGGTTELAQVLGLMADNGIKGAEAGTHLRNIMLSLTPKSEAAAAAMEALGFNAYDANGELRPLEDTFADLSAALDGMSTEERTNMLSAMFNKTDLSAVNALLATNSDRWADVATKIDGAWFTSESLNESFGDAGLSMADMESKLSKLGISADTFNNILTQSSGDAEMFADDLWEAADAGVSYEDVVNALGGDLGALQTAFDNTTGAAQAMADTQLDNLEGDITLFQSALEGAQIAISDSLTPVLRDFVQFGSDGLSQLTSAFKEGGLDAAMETFGQILSDGVAMIIEGLPQMIDAGIKLIGALAQGILDNISMIVSTAIEIVLTVAQGLISALPQLGPAIVDIILAIVEGLLDNLDLIVRCALELVVGLALGLINALPRLIEKAPEIISKLVQALIQAAPQLIKAAGEMIAQLAKGIVAGVSTIIRTGLDLLRSLYNALFNNGSSFSEIGSNIIQGIRNGISNAWNGLVSWFKGLFGDLTQIAKDILGIASPSKVFKQIGEYTVEGFDEGMSDFGQGAMSDVQSAMNDIANVQPSINPSALNYTVASTTTVPDINRKLDTLISLLSGGVNVTLEGDAQGLFRQVRKEVNQFTKSTGNSPFIAPA